MYNHLRNNPQVIEKNDVECVANLSGMYIAPEIEVLHVEMQQHILQNGSGDTDDFIGLPLP